MQKLIGLTGSADDKYRQVAKWTRRINLAEKVAIVAPVFFADHWFLLVATDMSGSHPTVTVLNSIPGYGNEEQAAAAFIEYLRVACKEAPSVFFNQSCPNSPPTMTVEPLLCCITNT